MGMGWEPYEIMLQQMAKRDDPFPAAGTIIVILPGGEKAKPQMIHQSSATGMQAIPSTGIAQGIQYMTEQGLLETAADNPIVLCSIGDGAMTEGEVSEALQFAVLKRTSCYLSGAG